MIEPVVRALLIIVTVLTTPPKPVHQYSDATWEKIGICETGHAAGNPNPGQPYWTRPRASNPRSSGGLGMLSDVWDDNRDSDMPWDMGQASVDEQITVAERVKFWEGCWGPGKKGQL